MKSFFGKPALPFLLAAMACSAVFLPSCDSMLFTGYQGEQGEKGEQGDKGDKGDKGAPGGTAAKAEGSEISPTWAVSLVSKAAHEFTILDNAALVHDTGQGAEYALTLVLAPPGRSSASAQEWTAGAGGKVSFLGLTPDTEYYVWARSRENAAYAAGAAKSSMGGTVTTDAQVYPGAEISPSWAVSLVSRGKREFTILDNATLASDTGQGVEYALTLGSAPPSGAAGTIQEWAAGTGGEVSFLGLTPDTEYRVWARAKESAAYDAGPAKAGGTVRTAALTEFESFIESLIVPASVGAPFSPTYANGPANKGNDAFEGAVVAPNGKVILVPSTTANVGIYDPAANAFTDGPAHGKEPLAAFEGGVLAPNGKVILVPCNSANIGIYDPATNTYAKGPAHGQGAGAFNGGVLAPDGKVILVPLNSANIGIYDPAANAYADGPAHGQGAQAFQGGVLAPNGKVILVPQDSANIGIYDPIANTYAKGPAHGKGATAFQCGVLAPDGKVILVPYDSANIGIYDPATNAYSDGPAHGQGAGAFNGGVLAPDGKVILVPCNSANIGIYDPATNTYAKGPAHGQGAGAFNGGVLAPDGKVILVPLNSANIGIYDPAANAYAKGPAHGKGAAAFQGGVLAPNGKAILVPCNSANIGILSMPGLECSLASCLSPFINKY